MAPSASSRASSNGIRSLCAFNKLVRWARVSFSEVGFAKSGAGEPPILMTDASDPFPSSLSSEVENVRAWEKPFWAFIEKLSSNKTTVEEGTSPERARTESWLFGFGIIPVSAPRIYNNTHAQSVPPQILARGSRATKIKNPRATRGRIIRFKKGPHSVTTIRASARARRIGMMQRIMSRIICSSCTCFRFLRKTDSSK